MKMGCSAVKYNINHIVSIEWIRDQLEAIIREWISWVTQAGMIKSVFFDFPEID
jgi:hypothetical protein